MGGRHFQRPGPSPTLGSLGPFHQRRHKSRVSLWGPPYANDVLGTPHGEVRNMLGIGIIEDYRLCEMNEVTSLKKIRSLKLMW